MASILGIALGILILALYNDINNHPRGGGTAVVCG